MFSAGLLRRTHGRCLMIPRRHGTARPFRRQLEKFDEGKALGYDDVLRLPNRRGLDKPNSRSVVRNPAALAAAKELIDQYRR